MPKESDFQLCSRRELASVRTLSSPILYTIEGSKSKEEIWQRSQKADFFFTRLLAALDVDVLAAELLREEEEVRLREPEPIDDEPERDELLVGILTEELRLELEVVFRRTPDVGVLAVVLEEEIRLEEDDLAGDAADEELLEGALEDEILLETEEDVLRAVGAEVLAELPEFIIRLEEPEGRLEADEDLEVEERAGAVEERLLDAICEDEEEGNLFGFFCRTSRL